MVNQRGYTLVELAVAISLIGIVAAIATQSGGRGLQGAAQGFQQTKAQHLVVARLESLRARSELPDVGETRLTWPAPQTQGLAQIEGVQTVRAVEPGLVEVEVRLSWVPAPGARRRAESLTTWLEVP